MSTDRPASWWRRPPRLVRRVRSPTETLAGAPHRTRGAATGASASVARIDFMRLGGPFVEPDEVAEGHRIRDVVGVRERVDAEALFQPRDEDRDGQRIEPGLEQHQVVRQGRQRLLFVPGDLLDQRNHGRFYGRHSSLSYSGFASVSRADERPAQTIGTDAVRPEESLELQEWLFEPAQRDGRRGVARG